MFSQKEEPEPMAVRALLAEFPDASEKQASQDVAKFLDILREKALLSGD